MATATTATDRTAALAEIHVANNVRALDPEHVRALAGSIRLQGVLVPVVVRPADREIALAGWKFELVAGFHRVAAAAELRLNEIPVVVREADTEAAATENIARKQLNPYEPARAVEAMLAKGLSQDGAALALGWPKARVTARMKLLELPDRARQLVGRGVIALSAVDQLVTGLRRRRPSSRARTCPPRYERSSRPSSAPTASHLGPQPRPRARRHARGSVETHDPPSWRATRSPARRESYLVSGSTGQCASPTCPQAAAGGHT